jgi:hypothetical protein
VGAQSRPMDSAWAISLDLRSGAWGGRRGTRMLDGWIPISGAVFALQLGRGSHTAPVASEWPPPAAHPCVAGF